MANERQTNRILWSSSQLQLFWFYAEKLPFLTFLDGLRLWYVYVWSATADVLYRGMATVESNCVGGARFVLGGRWPPRIMHGGTNLTSACQDPYPWSGPTPNFSEPPRLQSSVLILSHPKLVLPRLQPPALGANEKCCATRTGHYRSIV